MDLDYSAKVVLIEVLKKLINFNKPEFPIGSLYYDTRCDQIYISVGHSWILIR